MKKTFLVISTLLLATLACNITLPQTEPTIQSYPNQPQTQGQTDLPLTESDVPRVTAEDAKAALDSGEAVIVDVRSAEAYAEAHAAGALSIPLDEFENNITNIPLDKNQWIITYCT
jgi:3-mercaptopyruvate sulfurtransferase SseA